MGNCPGGILHCKFYNYLIHTKHTDFKSRIKLIGHEAYFERIKNNKNCFPILELITNFIRY